MAQLTSEHIAYIIKDLNYRGIVAEEIQDELIDHVCGAVEAEMEKGGRFIDVYHKVLKTFGHTEGLRETQNQTLQIENQKTKNMLKNYLTIAIRNLRKHRFYTAINVLGLSSGIAVCLVIVLFVLNELNYDRHHEKADRIFRIQSEIKFGGNHWNMVYAPAPMAATLVSDFPEIEASIRFRERGSYLVKREKDNIKESHVIWADKDLFKIFTIPFLDGNPDLALAEPNTIAISERTARKFFSNESALGQTLTLDNEYDFKITGIYQDMPLNSHFHFDLILSMEGLDEAKNQNWMSNNFQTYMLLRENSHSDAVLAKLPQRNAKYVGPQAAAVLGGEFTMDKFEQAGNKMVYGLQPLLDIHLHSSLLGELEPTGNITYVYLFSTIALFILLIACINFMNLSTARSANRAKEVGVRKVMGSLRSHLVRQFLTESTLLSLFSFVLALGLAYLLLPVFNNLSGRELTLPFENPWFHVCVFGFAVVIGFLAGLYPSFFLSAFKPVNVLKGNVALGMKSGLIRSSLVVFQFAISILLVIGTITIFRQLNFIENKKLGFNRDQVIIIQDAYALGEQRVTFKNEILKNSQIISGTISGYLPVSGTWRSDNSWWPEGKSPTQENMVNAQYWGVDHDYVKTMGMQVNLGRDFSLDFPSDSSAVIMNETAIKNFGIEDDPIGKKISTFRGNDVSDLSPENIESKTVIGVVENFHFASLKKNIGALMLHLNRRPQGMVSFRFNAPDTRAVIGLVEKQWKEMAPGQPLTYSFLDEDFGRMYAAETRLGKIFAIFSALAIIIACLGLFALTAFTAEQRTKEIGIRKVLGASVASIMTLLSKEFGKLVLIAFVIVVPVAWWGVGKWLEDYEFKVTIGWGIYLMAGLASFAIAWLTMSYQSFRAASADPVKSLRSE